MKNFILCLAIVGIGFQIGAAQRYGPEQRAKMQERIESQRIAYITQKLDLTPRPEKELLIPFIWESGWIQCGMHGVY